MNRPSAVHVGETNPVFSSLVSARGLLPSALTIQRFVAPLRSLTYTMCLPSGEKRGSLSYDSPDVIGFAVPPCMGSVYKCPTRSNTSVFPSGDTSRDIHVPSSVE